MSYTVVIDHLERQRQMVNLINRQVRHCRIGKITPKTRDHFPFKILPVDTGRPIWWPFGDTDWKQTYADAPIVPPMVSFCDRLT